MAVKLSPFGPKPQFFDSNGDPLNGGFLYFYVAGSATPQNTYTTSLGNVANSHPIELNARGECSNQIWFTEDTTYKATLTTAAGVEIWSSDNLAGINDTSISQDEWSGGTTPTYISATSFSVTGDQSSTYHKGRRLKTTNTGGTVYSTITAVAYASVTTVTVVNDSGSLDSGLSAVSYGLLSANNPSVSSEMIYRKATAVASAATCNIWSAVGDLIHVTGNTGPITSFGTAPYAGAEKTVIFDSTPTITHNATSLILPVGANITASANSVMTIRADTTANMIVTSYFDASTGAVISAATDTVAGKVELATTAEVQTGTDTSRAVTPAGLQNGKMVNGTPTATTSGTTKDFTIPSWAKQVTVCLNGVSLSGTDNLLIQIGDSGGIENTNYIGCTGSFSNAALDGTAALSAGFTIGAGGTGAILNGSVTITLSNASTFTWTASGVVANSAGTSMKVVGGYKALSAALTTVRLAATGTDTFDAGEVNVLYS